MVVFHLLRHQTFSNQLSRGVFGNRLKNAMEHILKPPEEVYLMENLNKSVFEKVIKVPVLSLGDTKVSSVIPLVKTFLLKIENFKPINHINKGDTIVYLNPEALKKWTDLPAEVISDLKYLKLSQVNFQMQDFTLKYENFSAETILRAVLPREKEGVSSFTKVGHIVHVNLREHLNSYKNLIGEVLFDKIKGCESVVNKVNMIDNTYRNFQMEVLKGENNMHTTVKENNCKFEFDFSTVYWNSRLCTEHERIVKLLQPNDVFFDVFAGVGPFSIPAAKKKCKVFANDLNPESFRWLIHNKKLNKISDEYFSGFSLDGRDFILKIIKKNLPKYFINHSVVITMNLPALAVEFLEAFIGLFRTEDIPEDFTSVIVYVYCFAKGENPEEITRNLIRENLKIKNVNIDTKISEIFKVRTVSSLKEMMRVKLNLDRDILVGATDSKRKIEDDFGAEGELKKICLDTNGKDGQEQEEIQQRFQGGRRQELENESQGQSGKD